MVALVGAGGLVCQQVPVETADFAIDFTRQWRCLTATASWFRPMRRSRPSATAAPEYPALRPIRLVARRVAGACANRDEQQPVFPERPTDIEAIERGIHQRLQGRIIEGADTAIDKMAFTVGLPACSAMVIFSGTKNVGAAVEARTTRHSGKSALSMKLSLGPARKYRPRGLLPNGHGLPVSMRLVTISRPV